MRTDDLIAALARDPAPVTPPVGTLLLRSLLVTVPVSLLLLVMTLGIRDDVGPALGEGWFAWKLAVVALLGLAAWSLVRSTAGPGRMASLATVGVAIAALVIGSVADLGLLGRVGWSGRMVGDNGWTCLAAIPLLSVVPLAGVIHALRDGAPTRPALAGAMAGLMAGAVGAFLYGLHCTDDSPLFLNVWYLAAMALVAMAGAALGRFLLRW